MSDSEPNVTADYHTLPDGRLSANNRPPVALVFGAAPTSPDLTELLRSRLQFAALVFVAVYGMTLFIQFQYITGRTGIPTWELAVTGSLVLTLLVSVGVAWACWSAQWWTIRRLRIAEAVLFGTLLARNLHLAAVFPHWFIVWNLAAAALAEGRIVIAEELFTALSAEFFAPWMVLVITYGVLVPNSGRRSAVVVGALTTIGLMSWFVIGLAAGVRTTSWIRVFVTGYTLMLPAVAAVAVFASYRIDQSRQQNAEARRVGQYRLRRKLGEGGMGEVYLAEHLLLRRPCAVKVIRPDRVDDPQVLARFEREVQLTATLTHPNTVQVYDYGRADDGTFYYAMEYLPGQNLDELVAAAGPLSPARAIHFLRQLCGALAEAHAKGLIHRDIKPSNVIACERGGVYDVAKLLDFGLVRFDRPRTAKSDLTSEGVVTGTPAYLSPEQAAGDVRLDARSDIYSLGALAYFLLTGGPPFGGLSSVRMLAAHLHEPPRPVTERRPDVPSDLAAVVMRCLAKQPDDRFSDIRALDQALAESAGGVWTSEDGMLAWKVNPLRGTSPNVNDLADTRTAKQQPKGSN